MALVEAMIDLWFCTAVNNVVFGLFLPHWSLVLAVADTGDVLQMHESNQVPRAIAKTYALASDYKVLWHCPVFIVNSFLWAMFVSTNYWHTVRPYDSDGGGGYYLIFII